MSETLADKLRPYVSRIVADANAGIESASQIVKMYHMHCSCPNDPGAPVFCEEYFKQWLKERGDEH